MFGQLKQRTKLSEVRTAAVSDDILSPFARSDVEKPREA